MSKGELDCLQKCFRKQEEVYTLNSKHEDQLKIFLKYFFLLFKQSWYKIMEYEVNRIEFVKIQKTKYVIQMSKHIF